ncbi:MAG TPA: hypothetical protein VFA06_16910 [Actinocrinis sp.]|uniref:hypothetical protein n=1 Tax=Actinocrinis sp. TaxID=1920516 RepID=UPI002D245B16|nr:hypothetical protein [Actinocrinis sp.]HZU57553.1 hypothetical protein [Actinocrinis sp.]
MAVKRFSVSTDEETHAAIRAHAEAQGLDVSAYLMVAARLLMAQDDLVTARFADVDAAIAAAESGPEAPALPLNEEEAAAVDRFLDELVGPPKGQSVA